jgi:hypothetical protein
MENKFNLFENLGLNENQHTGLLKKLLSTTGKHNQQDLFLRTFLESVGITYCGEKWRVEKEQKSGKRGRIDLLLQTDNKTIIIENKINCAKNQNNQLYRYWKNHIFNKKIAEYKIIYLVKSKVNYDSKMLNDSITKPDCPTYQKQLTLPKTLPIEIEVMGYKEDILPWLIKCQKQFANSDDIQRLSVTLEQYIEFLQKDLRK